MALNLGALLELSEALKAGDGAQLMRTAQETMLQALVEAEATTQPGWGPPVADRLGERPPCGQE